jgi:two-component system sensor histidine kinase CpxA
MVDRREAVPILIIDPQGNELLGRPLPQRAARFYEFRRGLPHRYMSPRMRRTLIHLPDGDYRLFPDFRGVTLARALTRPRVMAVPFAVATLVSGLVGIFLARTLVSPIIRLRRATERYAEGDLSHRVGASMQGRRDEIGDLAQAFDYMAGRLQQLMAAQKQLLSDVSHELRSPLARLQVALALARRRAEDVAGSEFDRIERELERLDELIGQLLSLARLESGARKPAREPVELGALLKEVVEDAVFEARASNRDVRLKGTLSLVLSLDPLLLRSALENVIRNAVRHTVAGSSVEVMLERPEQSPNWVEVRVRDHGPGVPEHMLPHLFEPFVRADEARSRADGGYGLGLAIAERAVRLHGGAVAAHNEVDGGLTVTIRLPLS